ncbi:MAG TPA: hypothetical protein ENG87_01915 [Candidatus Pacearchaeota archaeon]|nr:hypothetical protein BMS3Abin17_00121 [archaeon BMS3Abin17]HDK42109.1 hypothetical protein [Candidatus Pacearchaeota archaeon]HDZ60138.1 hypothetical protein [Candidatus Pacearchaeota archaeon]
MKKQLNEDKERCPICKSYDHVNYDDTSGECDKEMKHKSLSDFITEGKMHQFDHEEIILVKHIKQSMIRIVNEIILKNPKSRHNLVKLKEIVGEDLI